MKLKLKFETFFRGYVFVLVCLLLWSVWGNAQTNTTTTNAPATDGSVTNAPVASGSSTNKADPSFLDKIDKDWITFGLDRVDILREKTLFGEPIWKYLASLVYIFLAFYISKLLDYLTRIWLKKWAKRTSTNFDDLILELLNGPVRIISFVIFLHVGMSVFDWPETLEDFFGKALKIIVACSITYMVLKFVDLMMSYWSLKAKAEEDGQFDQHLFPIIRKSLKAFIIVVAILVTSSNLGVNITGLIASLSIGGLALGLAAQDTLANLFGAVSVFADKPFRIGDRIQLDQVDGTVETIGIRSTRVRNLNGHLITVPNKTMGNATITNITRRPNIKTEMNIGVTYDTSPAKLRRAIEILETTYKEHPMTFELIVSFNQFAASSLNILVVHWWNSTDHKAYLAGMQEMNLKVKEQFDAEGIAFAFPSQTVYLKQDSPWQLALEQAQATAALQQRQAPPNS